MTIDASVLESVPGFAPNAHRGYCYIEGRDFKSFDLVFPAIKDVGGTPRPQSGGMVSEGAEVRLPTGECFFAVSFKGDRDGWLRMIKEFAIHRGFQYAEVDKEAFVVSDGRRVLLADCDFVQH